MHKWPSSKVSHRLITKQAKDLTTALIYIQHISIHPAQVIIGIQCLIPSSRSKAMEQLTQKQKTATISRSVQIKLKAHLFKKCYCN